MSKDIDDLVEEWHKSESKVSLREYLGWTEEDYAVWVEFDVPPGETISREAFLALRSDAYRWANDADNYLSENRRYKEAVSEIRAVAEDDWITDILDRNNV